MPEKSRQELVDEAEALGVATDKMTKLELEHEIGARQTPELGTPAPEGSEPDGFEQHGRITGVQPMTADEIPESGR